MPLVRRLWWPMSPHTIWELRPTQSKRFVRLLLAARAKTLVGSSASGSVHSFQMRFVNWSSMTSACETTSAGRYSTAEPPDFYRHSPTNSASRWHEQEHVGSDQ